MRYMVFMLLMLPFLSWAGDFSVKVSGIENGMFKNRQVFSSFGCSGENVSPEISWSNPPEGTESFVVTMYDPDAPTGSGWWHWVVTDIPADVTKLAEGAGSGGTLPAGAQNMNTDYGRPGYGGPCPPPGETHRYIITVYALKIKNIGVPASSSGAFTGFFTRANMIDSAETIVRYGR